MLQTLFANALQQRRIGGTLEKVNRVLRAMLECRTALIRARDEKALLTEVCRIVVEVGGFLQAWVGFDVGDAAHDQARGPVGSGRRLFGDAQNHMG